MKGGSSRRNMTPALENVKPTASPERRMDGQQGPKYRLLDERGLLDAKCVLCAIVAAVKLRLDGLVAADTHDFEVG